MAGPAPPRKTRPRSPTLEAAHEVIRALGLRDGEGDPPQGDAGTDSDLEAVPEPPMGGAPAERAPPAGSVPTLCPAWKQGHRTGEGWCPKQHPQPGPDDGALPKVRPAAACAALRYGVAQGWMLYPQTHIPAAGTSNRLGRLGLQRRVEAAHPGGVVEQWLTLRSPSAAEGHWYLQQHLFLPRAAPEHRRQNPYHTHPERRGAQGFPQPVPPALLPGQGPEALQQGTPLDTATTVQQRGRDGADGAEPDVTNCRAVAWMAACRHLARDTTGLRQYRPTDRTALASAVAAVTMGPVAAWPAQLLPHVPCRATQAATHAPTAPLTAEQL